MPRHRPPREVWKEIRRKVWQRDRGLCQGPYCQGNPPLPLDQVHVDHKRSGKLANNKLQNQRLLCRRCHVLRIDPRHRGMIASALRDGIIPVTWRQFLWDEGLHWPSPETIAKLKRWISGREELP